MEAINLIEERDDQKARLILTGVWYYDNLVPMEVSIYALNYDFYYDMDDLYDDPSCQPALNIQGEQYVVMWTGVGFFGAKDFPSNGFMTVEDAKRYAESVVKSVNWSKPLSNEFI